MSDRPDSFTSTADNAENSVKCEECGNTILLGDASMSTDSTVKCDVCGATQSIGEGEYGNSGMGASSNEDY